MKTCQNISEYKFMDDRWDTDRLFNVQFNYVITSSIIYNFKINKFNYHNP